MRTGSWPKETKIILCRWGRGMGEEHGRRQHQRGGDSPKLYTGWGCFCPSSPGSRCQGRGGGSRTKQPGERRLRVLVAREGEARGGEGRGKGPAHSSPLPSSPKLVCSLAKLGGSGSHPLGKGHSAKEGSQPEGRPATWPAP